MKKLSLKLIAAIALFSLVLTSCAFHGGYFQSSAALCSANYSYIGHLQGTSKATYIFGIGGLAKNTLVENAKENMLRKNPLNANQALVNTTVNFKNTCILGIYYSVKCTVTADLVEFNKEAN